jgi:hypothetical protein
MASLPPSLLSFPIPFSPCFLAEGEQHLLCHAPSAIMLYLTTSPEMTEESSEPVSQNKSILSSVDFVRYFVILMEMC